MASQAEALHYTGLVLFIQVHNHKLITDHLTEEKGSLDRKLQRVPPCPSFTGRTIVPLCEISSPRISRGSVPFKLQGWPPESKTRLTLRNSRQRMEAMRDGRREGSAREAASSGPINGPLTLALPVQSGPIINPGLLLGINNWRQPTAVTLHTRRATDIPSSIPLGRATRPTEGRGHLGHLSCTRWT